jgi:hypothetical protein
MAATVHRSGDGRRAPNARFRHRDAAPDPSTPLNAIANRFEWRGAGPVLQ